MTTFYVFAVNKGFICIEPQKKYKMTVVNIEDSTNWRDKSDANSWRGIIKYKFPEVKLKEATLTLKTSKHK